MFRIGLDVGGVIIDSLANDNTPTDFMGDHYLRTTAVSGALDGVCGLVERFGRDNVYIISKARRQMVRDRIVRWLWAHEFLHSTRLERGNVFFCSTWIDKTPIAAQLRLNAFVDDRCDVLRYMQVSVPWRFLFRPQPRLSQNTTGLVAVASWRQLTLKIDRLRSGRPVR
ncbi:MAG: hypothetical protein PVI21_00670 [Candidatus Woesebacteria bacterium]|jgi:hypothetical protein